MKPSPAQLDVLQVIRKKDGAYGPLLAARHRATLEELARHGWAKYYQEERIWRSTVKGEQTWQQYRGNKKEEHD